jgi:uncharacterized protein (DUF1501 family)
MDFTRRRFIQMAGSGMTALALPPLFARQAAAQAATPEPVIVMLFLRGGADALTHVLPDPSIFPGKDPAYALQRPFIGLPLTGIPDTPDQLITPLPSLYRNAQSFDPNFFGMNSTLDELLHHYNPPSAGGQGNLAIVHACGNTEQVNYSHFTAEDAIERGVNHPSQASSGWLTRAVEAIDPETANPLAGVSVSPNPLTTLSGGSKNRTLALSSINALKLEGHMGEERESALRAIYEALPEGPGGPGTVAPTSILGTAGRGLYTALERVTFADNTPEIVENVYGVLDEPHIMRNRLRDAARLIKQPELGVRAVAMDFVGNWDYHTEIPKLTPMYTLRLAATMKRFYDDLSILPEGQTAGETAADRTVTVVMSEFGRVVKENGGAGTDHGHGGLMYVLGSGVVGSRVLSRGLNFANDDEIGWPGLADEFLHRGRDLQPTIDFRDVLAQVITQQYGALDMSNIFPDYTLRPLPDGGLF